MHQFISEIPFTILDIVLFLGGLTLLFFIVSSQNNLKTSVQNSINEKSNVFEIRDEYTGTVLTVHGSSIPGDILQYDQSLKVVISGYTVTDSVKEALKNHHDVAEIISKISLDRDYEKSYEFDEKGHITGVFYR